MNPGIRQRLIHFWRKTQDWFVRFWAEVHPGPEAFRGAIRGALLSALASVLIAAWFLDSGFGAWLDLLFCLIGASLIVLLSFAVIGLALRTARVLPVKVTALSFGAVCIVALPFIPAGFVFGPSILFVGGITRRYDLHDPSRRVGDQWTAQEDRYLAPF